MQVRLSSMDSRSEMLVWIGVNGGSTSLFGKTLGVDRCWHGDGAIPWLLDVAMATAGV